MLRVLYGGTFDPVHAGHLAIARVARDALAARVDLMPAADPPHRPPPGAGAAHRARMLELAVAGERGLAVDRRELDRDGRSYTVDTLRALRAEIGIDAPVALLLGADSLLALPTWKEWTALFDLAHLVVAQRAGSALDGALPPALADALRGRTASNPAALVDAPAGRVFTLSHPLHPASATELRRRIAAGRPWADWVEPAVAAYIGRHALYAGVSTDSAVPPAPGT